MNVPAPRPTMHKLKSSNIKAVGYDAAKKEIHIEFHSGATWAYADCEPELFDALRQHESPGSYFHKNVKQIRPGRKLA